MQLEFLTVVLPTTMHVIVPSRPIHTLPHYPVKMKRHFSVSEAATAISNLNTSSPSSAATAPAQANHYMTSSSPPQSPDAATHCANCHVAGEESENLSVSVAATANENPLCVQPLL